MSDSFQTSDRHNFGHLSSQQKRVNDAIDHNLAQTRVWTEERDRLKAELSQALAAAQTRHELEIEAITQSFDEQFKAAAKAAGFR